jgi:hypothetical protein
VLGALAEPDERDVGMFLAGQLDDLLDVQFLPDDLVAERAGDLRDGLGPLGALLATSTCSSGRSGHWSAWDGLLDAEVNRQRLDAIGRLVDEGEAAPSDRGGTAIRAGPRSPGTSRRSTYAGQGRTSDWVGRRS